MAQLDVGNQMVSVGNLVLERDVLNIIQRIKEYDENLEVLYLDPEQASDIFDAPYVIAERANDGRLYRVFEVWELNMSVLDRIRAADTKYVDVEAAIERTNTSAKESLKKQAQEDMDTAHDITVSLLRSPKTTYSIPTSDGTITIDSHAGVVKRNGQSV